MKIAVITVASKEKLKGFTFDDQLIRAVIIDVNSGATRRTRYGSSQGLGTVSRTASTGEPGKGIS